MTISFERILALISEYEQYPSAVPAQQVIDSLRALMTEEEDQMDSYYSSQAAALGYKPLQ